MIKIELWSDFACPFCYIAKTRFDRALENFKHKDHIQVIYKAYQLNPYAKKIMDKTAEETFADSHNISVEEARRRFSLFVEYGKAAGLKYNFDIIQMTNTFDAHRLAKYANTLNLEAKITSRFMKAYFSEGSNLADRDTLIKLSTEIGLNEREVINILDSNEYGNTVKEQMLESTEVGVKGVPFFVLNRKYAISGSQPEDYFTNALELLWNENNEFETLDDKQDNTRICNDDNCDL